MTKRQYHRKLIYQKLLGVVLLIACALILWLASTGTTPTDRDATPILFLGPLGLYLIFTKHIVIR